MVKELVKVKKYLFCSSFSIFSNFIGKTNVQWPGLNAPLIQGREVLPIMERPPDPMREQRLLEVRNRLDRFRRLSIPPSERGFTGGSPAGKSLGQPESIHESIYLLLKFYYLIRNLFSSNF